MLDSEKTLNYQSKSEGDQGIISMKGLILHFPEPTKC